MSLLLGVLLVVWLMLLVTGIRRWRAPGLGTELPQLIFGERAEPERLSLYQRHVQRSALQLPKRFGFLRAWTEPEQVAKKLQYAGRPYGMDVEQFFGFQLFMMIVGFALAAVYLVFAWLLGCCGGPIALIVLPIGGFLWPKNWLNSRVKQRQEAINLSMPDFLDTLAISVRAGMGFDNALRLVVLRTSGPLSEELRRLLRELDMGEPRAEAFRRLVQRNTSDDLRAFSDAVLQADELGTPIAKVLQDQAEDLRVRRVQRAKERAGKASPQISLVTVFIIAPSALLLFMAALVLSIFFGQSFNLVPAP